ncbi:terminase large subunit domain-containing protein [Roseinatronobacter sp. S2]|uniref:terminase large subunit domain-containing protein n=1 Tax=Roseinatronobacter sp. S2 TaxID=3035471 RepID=UPI0024101244|nr:terminase family protein [Roseinatronobacter sp. S2]WFE74250.1 terminase family protein [Roseinatronobacter sp. S2]
MSFSPDVRDFLSGITVALDPVQRFRSVIGEPDPWQERLLRTDPIQNETDKLVLTLVGRQSGKSTTCGCLAYDDFSKGKTVVLTAPSLRQSTELFRRILAFKHADPFCPPIVRQTQTELEAHPRHGGRIVVVPATDQARGMTADTILGDEACFITPDEALLAFFPMRKSTGRILLLSTPNGTRTGYFYETWESQADVRRIKAVSMETNRPERLEQIEFDRRTMPDMKFRREHLCEWVGSGESLLSWKVLEQSMNNTEEALCL